MLADAPDLASLVGEQTRLLWPADYGLRRIAVRDPTPVYPHSLIWRNDNPHPALATLRDYLGATRPRRRDNGTWAPGWARRLAKPEVPRGRPGGLGQQRLRYRAAPREGAIGIKSLASAAVDRGTGHAAEHPGPAGM